MVIFVISGPVGSTTSKYLDEIAHEILSDAAGISRFAGGSELTSVRDAGPLTS